jgi:hypothetical protein
MLLGAAPLSLHNGTCSTGAERKKGEVMGVVYLRVNVFSMFGSGYAPSKGDLWFL